MTFRPNPLLRSVFSAAVLATCFAREASAVACGAPEQVIEATPEQVVAFFAARRWRVASFFGYSGAEYEHPDAMLARAGRVLDRLDPKLAVVNIGATAQGIGAVYELAKQRGFTTTGIVSSQAREQGVALSPCVDHVFYVQDAAWGGYLPGTTTLTPTSEAMVRVSHMLVAIGGGEVVRDELLAAAQRGKRSSFTPADMNHRLARDKAAAKGQPAPTDFRGAAHAALRPGR
jgi:hypothetical protein